jgi:putative endonuclease
VISARIAEVILRSLDRLRPSWAGASVPAHLATGRRGEEDAYFYLRRKGYVIVARNFRTSRHRGEIDLIGWDKDVLCFIEVKTRTTRDVKRAEAAVDRKKRRDLRVMIRYYLRTLPRKQFVTVPQWRFDIVTVYYELDPNHLEKNTNPLLPKSGRTGTPSGRTSALSRGKETVHPTFELFQNAALSS